MTEPSQRADARLTVILPTRNRARYCAAQLRFFRACGLTCPIVVADSSDPAEARAVRNACAGVAQYLGFDPSISFTEKFVATLAAIETPYVVTTPDDDVTFPHAIAASLAHLEKNPDYVAAHGYVLNFGTHGADFDMHRVYSFAPTIGQPEPLQRLYHLIRRYQPFIWAVFRTQAFVEAMRAANSTDGLIFQELTLHTTAVLRGKVARLPVVYAMRGMEESISSLNRIHPFFWFVEDSDTFLRKYTAYRNNMLRRVRNEALAPRSLGFRLGLWKRALSDGWEAIRDRGRDGLPALSRAIRTRGLAFPDGSDPQQALDLIHAIWLGHEIDFGILNHTVRRQLGEPMPAIRVAPAWPGWREPAEGDVVHPSGVANRRYVWRRSVLTAEPREEITIDERAMAEAERDFDAYRLD